MRIETKLDSDQFKKLIEAIEELTKATKKLLEKQEAEKKPK